MALTRKLLKSMGLSDEQIDSAIEAHTETVDGLKAEIAKYKADAEALPAVQKELDELKSGKDWKAEYDRSMQELADYRAQVAAKEQAAKVESAYRALLKSSRVDEKRMDAILKVTDLTALELAEDGTLKDADKLSQNIQSEWAGFIRAGARALPCGTAPAGAKPG